MQSPSQSLKVLLRATFADRPVINVQIAKAILKVNQAESSCSEGRKLDVHERT